MRLVSVVKMVTMLEEYTTEDKHSVVYYLWAKGLSAKDIHIEMFPAYGGKCFLCKAVHWRQRGWNGGAEVAETTYAAGFNALAKRWDKGINVGGEYVEK
jgi:hypothetical protein